jgi:hypothetical protein
MLLHQCNNAGAVCRLQMLKYFLSTHRFHRQHLQINTSTLSNSSNHVFLRRNERRNPLDDVMGHFFLLRRFLLPHCPEFGHFLLHCLFLLLVV